MNDKLSSFDLIHVFSAYNGNHRIIQESRFQGVSTVLSPLHQPKLQRFCRLRYKLGSMLANRISGYELKTTYDEVKSALEEAVGIIAQSEMEKKALTELYLMGTRKVINVIPNGVSAQFFDARNDEFQDRFDVHEPFIFVAGSVSAYKNQRGVIDATAEDGWPVILAGPVSDARYLDECLSAGQGRVSYIGSFEHGDPILASCYAAAGVTVLISNGETFGLTAVESLAAGTPAIITRNTGLEISPQPPFLTYVNPSDRNEVRDAIRSVIKAAPNPDPCRALVENLTWDRVAEDTLAVYREIVPQA